ncbi:hypothetical protein QFC21_006538 [Naganishia friedmannii]|uniref:Uncharacterized protein n=1 Tax=Naganishia friedmannii TaxID=89922 RepID=A0ACC2V358_9TREE|nr:hypothetical protein QFC21_006538 [Naganishia friedmannii]
MDYRQYAPGIQQRGQSTATGNCRRRGQGDGTSSRKVRLQHANVNVQQKMASSSIDEQKFDTKPQQPEKTVDPTGQDDKPSQAQSQQAAPSSTGAGSSDQHANKSDSHGEVPSVQVPTLKQGQLQTAGKPSGGDMVIQQKMQNELVRLHNLIRQENGVGAVQWDDKLAEYSAGWMGNCLFEHSGG